MIYPFWLYYPDMSNHLIKNIIVTFSTVSVHYSCGPFLIRMVSLVALTFTLNTIWIIFLNWLCVRYFQWLSVQEVAWAQLILTIGLISAFALFGVRYRESILEGHRWATVLKTWFPIVMLSFMFLFVGGVARLYGQEKAEQIRNEKIQVVLMYDNKPVTLEADTYYISHTKRWIYFYNKNQPNEYIAYPLSTALSSSNIARLSAVILSR